MAVKVEQEGAPAAPKGAAGVNDLDVLDPDRQLRIGDRVITVREYRFFEGKRMQVLARPFFDALYALFDAGGAAPSFDDISELIAGHEAEVTAMVAAAADLKPEIVAQLGDDDGEALLVTWWMVNAGFFTRRVLRRAAQARFAAANQPAGRASSTPSSPPDTSAASPSSPG